MAPRKKVIEPKTPEFPPDCCGVCQFSRSDGDTWECWVNEPKVVTLGGELGFSSRAAPIDSPFDPACGVFKPRMNA
jgi:hypothetical protein